MNHTFKKNFGQNFLRSSRFAEKLVSTLELQPTDIVIEIGPGDGSISSFIIENCKKLIAIEVDYSLLPNLIKKFDHFENFELVNEDILQLNLNELLDKYADNHPNIKVVGSLPYNIYKKIINKLIDFNLSQNKYHIETMSFILQEEVAKNYVAQVPDAQYLSNYARLYTTVKKYESIPASQFFPRPKVNSAIISFKFDKEIPQNHLEIKRLIKIGFASPRKTLRKNLSSLREWESELITEAIKSIGLDEFVRASELSLEQWVELYERLEFRD